MTEVTAISTISSTIDVLSICNIPDKFIKNNYNKGDEIIYGRHKGAISKEYLIMIEGNIDEIIDILSSVKENIDHNDIEFNFSLIIAYDSQCNFEIAQIQMKNFCKLDIPLEISCYQSDFPSSL